MTRRMYDAVNPWAIPAGPELVAGYIDCGLAWTPAGWARFPNAVKVRIAAGCDPQDAQVADVETGDYLPWQAVDFVLVQRAKGIDPTVYVEYSKWAATQTEFRLRGVAEPHWWIALWDNVPQLLPGAVAKQYADPPASGGNYDLSIVADFWPGVDSAYGPATGEDDMTPEEHDALMLIKTEIGVPLTHGSVADLLLSRTQAALDGLAALKSELDQVKAAQAASSPVADATALMQIGTKLDRILAELHTP